VFDVVVRLANADLQKFDINPDNIRSTCIREALKFKRWMDQECTEGMQWAAKEKEFHDTAKRYTA
jgi:hypothetical protein